MGESEGCAVLICVAWRERKKKKKKTSRDRASPFGQKKKKPTVDGSRGHRGSVLLPARGGGFSSFVLAEVQRDDRPRGSIPSQQPPFFSPRKEKKSLHSRREVSSGHAQCRTRPPTPQPPSLLLTPSATATRLQRGFALVSKQAFSRYPTSLIAVKNCLAALKMITRAIVLTPLL